MKTKAQKEQAFKKKDRVVSVKASDKNKTAKLAENIRKKVGR